MLKDDVRDGEGKLRISLLHLSAPFSATGAAAATGDAAAKVDDTTTTTTAQHSAAGHDHFGQASMLGICVAWLLISWQ